MSKFLTRKLFFTCAILLLVQLLPAQNNAHKRWYFGNQAALNFMSGNPVALTNSAMNMFEGVSSISDSTTGNLLFYTDGVSVWNRNHVVMPNGTGLLGNNSSTQSAMIVPSPAMNGQYYIFTVGPNGLRYSIVNMSLNGGLGDVTGSKNVVLIMGTTEQQAAVYHQDCNRVWIMCHRTGLDRWYAVLLSSSGITGPIISLAGGTSLWGIGQMKFSPDGNRVAMRRSISPDNTVLCDFNKTTGTVSNCFDLTTGATSDNYGLSFSPNSNLLYVCSFNGSALSQFDLLAGSPAAVQASRVVVGSPVQGGSLQNGPDGRLYISPNNSTFLHRVNNPNTIGGGAGYQGNAVSLSGRTARMGLPNLNESWYSTTPCSSVILPFNWNSFEVQVEIATVFLEWEIEDSPSDLDHFLVQRSEDFVHWEDLQIVEKEAGIKASRSVAYQTTDKPLREGRFYYRIRKVGKDGTHAYSDTREVELSDLHPIRIFPNPVATGNFVEIQYTGASTRPLTASIHTTEGRLVRTWTMDGRNSQLDTRDLAPGLYLIKLSNGVEKWWNKLMVD